jgi:RHS repeat-associated protein
LYYTQDANFNVTALVAPDGTVVERYAYDPYGKVTVLDPDYSEDANGLSDFDNAILYCGYFLDWETGVYNVRRRPYHPTFGRLPSRDPMVPQPIGNLYSYVGDRPTDQRDPLGLSALTDSALAVTVAGTYIERAGRGPVQRVRNWMGNVEDDLRVRVVNAVASLLLRENSQLRALLDSKMYDLAADLCEAGPPIFYTESVPEEKFEFNSQPLSGVLGTGRLSGTMTGSVSAVSNCECGLFEVDATWTYKDVIQFMDWASAYQGGWFDNPISGLGAAYEGWLHLNYDTISGASYPLLATWNEIMSDCCESLEGNP